MQTKVYISQTTLQSYSRNLQLDRFPEEEALQSICNLSQDAVGQDLFKQTIRPGDKVVVKPNLVRDRHIDGEDLYSIITHPTVIRAVIDKIYTSLNGDGQIIIADAPMGDTDFDNLLSVTELPRICEYYWNKYRFQVDIYDLRQYRYRHQKRPGGYDYEVRSELLGNPEDYIEVDLGTESAFTTLERNDLLEGTDIARRGETIVSHTQGNNRYLISKTILDADVIVSVPKLKTHSKVGVTINCKGMVGINGDKNLLPHFRWGSPEHGGDQFPNHSQTSLNQFRMRLGRFVGDHLISKNTSWTRTLLPFIQATSGKTASILQFQSFDPINGDWPGNDTCWRLPVDLIRILLFADRRGSIQQRPQRRFLSVVDGIIAGEGDGPLRPTPKSCGVLIAGRHPVAVDMVCARLMGFDPYKIRYLSELALEIDSICSEQFRIRPETIDIISNRASWLNLFDTKKRYFDFKPPKHWGDHLKLGTEVQNC